MKDKYYQDNDKEELRKKAEDILGEKKRKAS